MVFYYKLPLYRACFFSSNNHEFLKETSFHVDLWISFLRRIFRMTDLSEFQNNNKKRCFLSHLTLFEQQHSAKLWLSLSLLWGFALYPAFINGIAVAWLAVELMFLILFMRRGIIEQFAVKEEERLESEYEIWAVRLILWRTSAQAIFAIYIVFFLTAFFFVTDLYPFETSLSFLEMLDVYSFSQMRNYDLSKTLDYKLYEFLIVNREFFLLSQPFEGSIDTGLQFILLLLTTLICLPVLSFICIGRVWLKVAKPALLRWTKYNDVFSYWDIGTTFRYTIIVFFYLNLILLGDEWQSLRGTEMTSDFLTLEVPVDLFLLLGFLAYALLIELTSWRAESWKFSEGRNLKNE